MKYHIEFDIDFKRNPYKGLYIVLEGIDGSGKTTQVEFIKKYFEERGREVVTTREPRKDKRSLIGKLIQEVLYGQTGISPIAFQYLFSADRQMHHEEVVIPALKEGKVVISDRCYWSAIPYGLLDKEESVESGAIKRSLVAQSILSFYHQFIVPDVTFYLDVKLKTALERIASGDGAKEIYEDGAKLKRAIKGYEWLMKEFPKEFTVINAEQAVEKVTEDILRRIKK